MIKDIDFKIIVLLTKLTQQGILHWEVALASSGYVVTFSIRINDNIRLNISKERYEKVLLCVMDYHGDYTYIFENTDSLTDLFKIIQAQVFDIEKLLAVLVAKQI